MSSIMSLEIATAVNPVDCNVNDFIVYTHGVKRTLKACKVCKKIVRKSPTKYKWLFPIWAQKEYHAGCWKLLRKMIDNDIPCSQYC
jgi:hypothetical protein